MGLLKLCLAALLHIRNSMAARFMNKAKMLGLHTHMNRGTCPGVGL